MDLQEQTHYLKRLRCDGCGKFTQWEFLPKLVYPKPNGWVLTKDVQLCGPCFKKKPIKNKDKMYDLYERVLEKRNIE